MFHCYVCCEKVSYITIFCRGNETKTIEFYFCLLNLLVSDNSILLEFCCWTFNCSTFLYCVIWFKTTEFGFNVPYQNLEIYINHNIYQYHSFRKWYHIFIKYLEITNISTANHVLPFPYSTNVHQLLKIINRLKSMEAKSD